MEMMVDVVITYVDGLDPVWQRNYAAATGVPVNPKRYRDWGTLKYLLRGIERHMDFVGNVFLVVSSESQVPSWADRGNLKVVLHSDIIPGEYLPVFNSTAIEMFLHRIPGLSERFIYFNDDMFPLRNILEESLFPAGAPRIGMARHIFAANLYKKQTKASYRLAAQAAGVRPGLFYLRPQHTCSPMLKSACQECFDAVRDEILSRVTPLREPFNVNQYLFIDYSFLKGLSGSGRISNRHFSLASAPIDKICRFVEKPGCDFACINDVNMPEEQYLSFRKKLDGSFSFRYPEKSRYEK